MSDSEAVEDVKFQGVSNCEAEMKLSYQVITSLIEKRNLYRICGKIICP